ncbi:unnamed protein product [Meganyctiphanes norvegica]|uniref:Secreted protein n=1 Tax=Meganyctiphanes norvegica TaxID=48144 RepID=A0AAV2SBV4_MEGNR
MFKVHFIWTAIQIFFAIQISLSLVNSIQITFAIQIASKFIASGLLSKFPCLRSTPLVATQRLQCFKVHCISCLWSTPLVATQRLQCSKFTASGLLSKLPSPWSTPLTFGRPSTFIVSGVLSDMFD